MSAIRVAKTCTHFTVSDAVPLPSGIAIAAAVIIALLTIGLMQKRKKTRLASSTAPALNSAPAPNYQYENNQFTPTYTGGQQYTEASPNSYYPPPPPRSKSSYYEPPTGPPPLEYENNSAPPFMPPPSYQHKEGVV